MFENIYSFITMICGYVCGQNPEHSPIFFGKQFLLCYRCSGIYGFLFIGFIIQACVKPRFSNKKFSYGFFFVILASALLGADVFILQSAFPNHVSRFISGSLVGASLSYFIWQCGMILSTGRHNEIIPFRMIK